MEKNKKIFMTCMSVLLVVVLLIGGSYAWFTLTLNGTKVNVLKSGTLSLRLDEENSIGINEDKAVPMLDEDGEKLDPYHFTLINEGSEYVEYTIYFDDIALEENETRMADNKVKYNLVKDTRTKTALLSALGVNPNRILDHGTIKGGQTITYDLRLWIDKNASNEVMGQVLRGKLRVVGTQVTETVLNEENLNMNILGTNEIGFSEDGNVPTTDEEGVKLEPYRFSLKNTSSDVSNYTVTLDDVSTFRMRSVGAPSDKVKYQLVKNQEAMPIDTLSNTLVEGERVLDTGKIEAGTTNEYELRLWIDESVSEEEANSYSLQASLRAQMKESAVRESCFVFDSSTGTISNYLCYEGNSEGYQTIRDVTIPNTIGGTEVLAIGNNAFENKKITSVVIPETVTSIGTQAFANNNLMNVEVPSSLTYLGNAAFNNNKLPDSNAFFYQKNSDGSNNTSVLVSYGGAKTTNVIIPTSVKTLGSKSMAYNNLVSVVIPSGTTTIGNEVFLNNNLTSIIIPTTVTSIGTNAFYKSATSNKGLVTIDNKTGRSFDWKSITGGSSSATFVGGTVSHPNGNIKVLLPANSNIVAVYRYNTSSCQTGEESTCVEIGPQTTYTAGTIIKYKVNASEIKYFHVMFDEGDTLVMQQRENTIYKTAWYEAASDNSKGPLTVLPALESATSSWTNVKDQTYTLGSTTFKTNAFTGCTYDSSGVSCTANLYTLSQRTGKARMITAQEAGGLGCTSSIQSCPTWMNNYLYNSTSYGGTVTVTGGEYGNNYGYWTMSAYSSSTSSIALFVNYGGRVNSNFNTTGTSFGARAVVVIDK